jgi:aspartate-semialdehyde dehydrogenase
MSNGVSKIVVASASGPATREFLATARESGFPGEIEAIAGAREESVGKLVGETALGGFSEFDNLLVISLDDAVNNGDAPVVVSFLQDEAAKKYEPKLAKDRLMITNSGVHRMESYTALSSPYTNPGQIDERFTSGVEGPYMIAVGNCTSVIASVPLAPIHERWGIISAEIETLQDWSGAGELEIPKGKAGLVIPIDGDEQDKIQTEPRRLLSPSMQALATIGRIKATPKRGPWWGEGHHELITIKLAKPTTAKEVEEAWRDWRAPDVLKGIKYGANSPKRKPIEVANKDLVYWDGTVPSLSTKTRPMRVKAHIREIQDEGHTIVFEALGDNLALGAAGSAAMILSYAREMGYL